MVAKKNKTNSKHTTIKSLPPPPIARLPEERAVLIQEVPLRKGMMNHSYRDYSKITPPPNYAPQTNIDAMSFAQKVYDMLSQPEKYEHCISWMPHGRSFKVHRPIEFEREVCPTYFGHGRYSSFLRSLNNYGFKHISKGTDRNCYYHELILRGLSHLCQFMPRCRDARRLSADPDNEPNFYCINKIVGAPDSKGVSRPVTPPTPTSSTAAEPNSSSSSSSSTSEPPMAFVHFTRYTPAPTVNPAPRILTPPSPPPIVEQDDNLVARLALAALLWQQLTRQQA